ncbi:hypothetical protein GY12_20465 [Micrococcus luteus]|nr:hypothetical protein GY12_20465 [Micrococcus luteus]
MRSPVTGQRRFSLTQRRARTPHGASSIWGGESFAQTLDEARQVVLLETDRSVSIRPAEHLVRRDIGEDHRPADRHRLQRLQWRNELGHRQGLPGQGEHIDAREVRWHVCVRNVRDEPRLRIKTACGDPRLQRIEICAPADDEEVEPDSLCLECRERVGDEIEAFVIGDAARETHDRSLRIGESQAAQERVILAKRGEHLWVNAVGRDGDLVRIDAAGSKVFTHLIRDDDHSVGFAGDEVFIAAVKPILVRLLPARPDGCRRHFPESAHLIHERHPSRRAAIRAGRADR